MPSQFVFEAEGVCPCCDADVTFRAENEWLRDHFLCPSCGSIPRERALMATIARFRPDWREATVHESSPVLRGTSARLAAECARYEASQFFAERGFGEVVQGFRNEDLERQTYPDEHFDLVVTQDVMEHVFHPAKAFREIARTLKPGGSHIFTTPLVNGPRRSEIVAKRKTDGEVVHLREPEYHGNPVDPEGSLVTVRWGYDIAEYIHATSGLFSTLVYIDDLSRGIRAELIEVVVSRKPA